MWLRYGELSEKRRELGLHSAASCWAFAVFLTAILAVAGEDVDPTDAVDPVDALDPSSLVGQLTVSQLKELIAETMTQASSTYKHDPPAHNAPTTARRADGDLAGGETTCAGAEEFYARYCCRSCTLAKQIPTYGPHLSLTAKAPISINVTTDTIKHTRGSNITITCEATGYPTPEVVWFKNYNEISSTGEYQEDTEVLGGILVKTIRSNLIIDNYSVDYSHFQCMAINSEGLAKSSITIYIEDELSVDLLPEVPIMEAKNDVVLDCVATGTDVNEVIWFREVELIHNSNEYRIIERRSFEEGLTKIHSKLTILRHKTEDSGSLFTCSAIDRKGGNKEKWKRVYISDVGIHPNCHDLAGRKACYEESHRCEYKQEYVYRYCCKTCTLMGVLPTYGPHLGGDAEAPLEVYIRANSTEVPYFWLPLVLRRVPGRSVMWLKRGEMIKESDNIRIKHDSTCSPLICEVNASLLIKGIKISDTGRYICRSSNVIEMKDATVLLRSTEDGEIYIDVDNS
ncbi:hemicentin-1-like [Penaeus monodon]|uniref:hemicentin-1-like n=1 Tax=Penaeus monodon TaxID=6687 RepID=UPI0018A701AE|nr:hemicentin-1-like [Penaeus monodon]